MRVTHKHGIKQLRATHAAYAKFFIVRPTQSVHVGSRVQKRRDTGDPYIYVVISLIPLYIVDEPMKGRVIIFVFDMKIGARRDRTTKSKIIK